MKTVIKRIVSVFLVSLLFIIIFYLLLSNYSAAKDSSFVLQATIYFSGFALTGFILLAGYLLNDYKKKRAFSRDVSRFSEMISRGNINDMHFYGDCPDLREPYAALKDIYDDLSMRFALSDEEKDQFDTIIQNVPGALLILNEQNDIVLSNERASKLFGISHLNNRSIFETIRNPEFIDIMESVKNFGKTGSGEFFLDYPEERYLQVRISPLMRNEKLHGMVVLFQNITELKKLETMRKDFVANVSHEIKTPVTAIKGFAETLIDGAINDKENALRFLNTIKSHSERLDRLVDDLMTISRIELGVIRLDKIAVDLSEVIDTVIDTFSNKAIEKGLTIKKVLNVEDTKIYANKDRTLQIFLNIIENAIKFSDKGNIEAGIDNDGSRNYFYVKDAGIGIPEKFIPRIGERFFRIDLSRSRELGGTGLGLAIVKHIVKAHGWEMCIESEEGKGTKIKVFY